MRGCLRLSKERCEISRANLESRSLCCQVGAPYATPDQLAALVANLSTDTMLLGESGPCALFNSVMLRAKRSSPEKFEVGD